MRRTVQAALSVLALAFAAAAPAAAGGLAVPLDGAVRLNLRAAAADVVVGNPAVADVAVVDERTVVVMGKAHGTTGVMVFDGARRVIWDGSVTVTAPPRPAHRPPWRQGRAVRLPEPLRVDRSGRGRPPGRQIDPHAKPSLRDARLPSPDERPRGPDDRPTAPASPPAALRRRP